MGKCSLIPLVLDSMKRASFLYVRVYIGWLIWAYVLDWLCSIYQSLSGLEEEESGNGKK